MHQERSETETVTDNDPITYQAAAAYVAAKVYDEACCMPDTATTLDDILSNLPAAMTQAFAKMGTESGLATVLRPEVDTRLRVFADIERARAEAGGFGYVLDLLADNLRKGANPRAVRADTLHVLQVVRATRGTAGYPTEGNCDE